MDDAGLIADLFAGASMSRFAQVRTRHRKLPGAARGPRRQALDRRRRDGGRQQAGHKLEQIRKEVEKAEEAFNATCDEYGDDSLQARTRSSIRPFSIAKMAVLPSTRTASIRWAKRLSCVKPAL